MAEVNECNPSEQFQPDQDVVIETFLETFFEKDVGLARCRSKIYNGAITKEQSFSEW